MTPFFTLDDIRHEHELDYRAAVDTTIVARDAIVSYYRHWEEPMRKPDLMQMVKVSPKQFPKVQRIVDEFSAKLDLQPPAAFVFQAPEMHFGVNVEGLDNPWLEISSYAIDSLDDDALSFLIARQLVNLKNDFNLYEILIHNILSATQFLNRIPGVGTILGVIGPEKLLRALQLVLYRYTRTACHTADRGAFLLTGSLATATQAILIESLRSKRLLNRADPAVWYRQIDEIDRMSGYVATLTKMDEYKPYGQYRIRDLIKFASRTSTKDLLRRAAASDGASGAGGTP